MERQQELKDKKGFEMLFFDYSQYSLNLTALADAMGFCKTGLIWSLMDQGGDHGVYPSLLNYCTLMVYRGEESSSSVVYPLERPQGYNG